MTRHNLKFILFSSILTIVFGVLLLHIKNPKWGLLGYICMSRAESISCYFAVYVSGMLFHLIFHKGRNRWIHILLTAGFPMFVFFGFFQEPRGMIYTIWGALGIFLLYLDIHYGQNKVSKRNRHTFFMHCFEKRTLQMMAWIGLFSMIAFGMGKLSNPKILHERYKQEIDLKGPDPDARYATELPKIASLKEGDLWEGNKGLYMELNSNRYPSKTIEERLNLWQAFVAIECSYLGVTKVPLVGTKWIERSGCHGYYDSKTETIIIAQVYLECDDAQYAIIKTLMHECYHHYSKYCTLELKKLKDSGVDMNLKFAKDINQWAYEQEHYVSYDPEYGDNDDFKVYEQQKLEMAATAYANEWAFDTWDFIQKIEPTAQWSLSN